MLVKLKTLVVENHGYKRQTSSKEVYVNTSHIVSISDYDAIEEFLLTENLNQAGDKFCLVKISEGNGTKEYITFGTSQSLYSKIYENSQGRKLLND